MSKKIFINAVTLHKITKGLTDSEVKVLLLILDYMVERKRMVFINNEESRRFLASEGYSRTPERVSTVLSVLASKGALIKEANAVFVLPEGLLVVNE